MDARDRSAMRGGDKGKISFITWDDNDNEVEHNLPTKFDVCPLCNGKGSHVNPSIDSQGLTADDFADDPDFYDEYMDGTYDQTCNECHGLRVVHVINVDACNPALYKAYQDHLDEVDAYERECDAERRMGC